VSIASVRLRNPAFASPSRSRWRVHGGGSETTGQASRQRDIADRATDEIQAGPNVRRTLSRGRSARISGLERRHACGGVVVTSGNASAANQQYLEVSPLGSAIVAKPLVCATARRRPVEFDMMRTAMEPQGTVITLNTQVPGRPNTTFMVICDFALKKVSLIAVDPTQQLGVQIVVNEVQDYTQPGR